MTGDVQPIQTYHKGYHFRSRLEARWSIFFDALNIKWEYEPEGFDIDGRWYLPDFYLPVFDCYVEIKPTTERDKSLYRKFPGIVNSAIILMEGTPWDHVAWWFGFSNDDDATQRLRRCHFLPHHSSVAFHHLVVETLEGDDGCVCNTRVWWSACGQYPGTYSHIDHHTTIGFKRFKKMYLQTKHTDKILLTRAQLALHVCDNITNITWDEFDSRLMRNNMMSKAHNAPKTARFEHGESGAT